MPIALCNRWQAITSPAEITELFLASTKELLVALNNQPDQADTIRQLRDEVNVAIGEQAAAQNTIQDLNTQVGYATTERDAANAAIQDLRTQLTARDATIATLNRLQAFAPA